MALDGRVEEARRLARQACQVAERCANEFEVHMRQRDYARVLLEAGDPQGALDAMPGHEEAHSYSDVRCLLVRAEAHQQLGHLSEAHDWLQRAQSQIEAHDHTRLRSKADELAQKL
jgi:hypothetical protein